MPKKQSSGFILPAVLVLILLLSSLMVFQVALQKHTVAQWQAYLKRTQSFYLAEAAYATWQWDLKHNHLPVERFDIAAKNLPIFLKDVYLNQAQQIQTPYGMLLYYAGNGNQVLALGSNEQKIESRSPKQMLYFDGEFLSQ